MKTRLLLAALIATSFAVAPAAFAEDAMSKPMAGDKMDNKMDHKDSMSKSSKSKKTGMKKDEMSKDKMMSDDKMKN